jgi:uncharacterized DUF497 family protein
VDFQWDDANIEHLGWHDVEPYEAEEVFHGDYLEYSPYVEAGELRFDLLGKTRAGRLLKIVYTQREDGIRVCSAFTPNQKERRAYHRRFESWRL